MAHCHFSVKLTGNQHVANMQEILCVHACYSLCGDSVITQSQCRDLGDKTQVFILSDIDFRVKSSFGVVVLGK